MKTNSLLIDLTPQQEEKVTGGALIATTFAVIGGALVLIEAGKNAYAFGYWLGSRRR